MQCFKFRNLLIANLDNPLLQYMVENVIIDSSLYSMKLLRYFCIFRLLTQSQTFSDTGLKYSIILSFYLNVFIGLFFFVGFRMFLTDESYAFFFATGHPVSRMTIFQMGICGALLHLRSKQGTENAL